MNVQDELLRLAELLEKHTPLPTEKELAHLERIKTALENAQRQASLQELLGTILSDYVIPFETRWPEIVACAKQPNWNPRDWERLNEQKNVTFVTVLGELFGLMCSNDDTYIQNHEWVSGLIQQLAQRIRNRAIELTD